MNKIYKIVFNRLTNASVVTSELAKGRGKTKNHIGKALLLTAICAGGIDTVEAAKVMGNGLRGDGTTISTGDVNVDHGIAIGTGDGADKARVVKDRAIAIGSNSTADGVMSIALGRKAQTEKDNSLAIGTNATTRYENSIAIGRDAYANADSHNSYSTDGIAIGNGAKTSLFGDTSTRFKLVKFGRNKVAEGISIGTKSIARTGSVQIGNQDYNGAIGEYNLSDVNNKLQGVNNVGATTVGDNSINRSHFSAVIGAYNSLSSVKQSTGFASLFDGSREASNSQGMGATILGTLNSMENLPSSDKADILKYSGISNSIVGTANKIKHSNGALIWGTGNEINRSILNMNEYLNVSGMNGNHSIKDLQNNLMTYSKTNRAGSVGVIGSDNEVNQTLF